MSSVRNQYGSQIDKSQIFSKSHNNNIFIHERWRTWNKLCRLIHKSKRLTHLPEHAFAYKRLFATMVKARNHKLNNFFMFPLEGKSGNKVAK